MSERFTAVAQVGEFGLIDRMNSRLGGLAPTGDLLCAIGDDAAVYRTSDDTAHVLTTDALIEGVHFDRAFMPFGHLGRKAVAVNVSDVAAMNAVPRYAVVAIGLPRNVSVEMVDALYDGLRDACARYGVHLVGGDTTAAPQLSLVVTVVGEAPIDRVVYRRGARPGDLLCVTGTVGGAYAGLQVLLEQHQAMRELGDAYEPDLSPYREVLARQLTPAARTDVVADWAARRVRPRALIDVSDGVASEVHHICRASGCGAVIRAPDLPVHPETRLVADERLEDADSFALFGGEDYELLFAMDPGDMAELDRAAFSVIGEFTDRPSEVVLLTETGDAVPVEAEGFTHFADDDT